VLFVYPSILKTSTFSVEDSAKTLSDMSLHPRHSITKIVKFSQRATRISGDIASIGPKILFSVIRSIRVVFVKHIGKNADFVWFSACLALPLQKINLQDYGI